MKNKILLWFLLWISYIGDLIDGIVGVLSFTIFDLSLGYKIALYRQSVLATIKIRENREEINE